MTIIQSVNSVSQSAVYAITRLDGPEFDMPVSNAHFSDNSGSDARLKQESLTLSNEALARSKDLPPNVLAVLRNAINERPDIVENAHAGLQLSRVLDLIG